MLKLLIVFSAGVVVGALLARDLTAADYANHVLSHRFESWEAVPMTPADFELYTASSDEVEQMMEFADD